MGRFNPFNVLLTSPLLRRVAWHTRRIAGAVDRRFFVSLAEGAAVFVAIAALLVTILEKPSTEGLGTAVAWFGKSSNWAIFTSPRRRHRTRPILRHIDTPRSLGEESTTWRLGLAATSSRAVLGSGRFERQRWRSTRRNRL